MECDHVDYCRLPCRSVTNSTKYRTHAPRFRDGTQALPDTQSLNVAAQGPSHKPVLRRRPTTHSPAPMANPARLLACVLAAGLLPSASAFPGDCTPIEAGSYTIDPRNEHLAGQPTCEYGHLGSPGLNLDDQAVGVAACAAVPMPYLTSVVPESDARGDACRAAVTLTDSQGTVVDRACYFNVPTEKTPDATMIATKAAAVALASPECAACAAAFEPDGGFDACIVSTDASCDHGRGIWDDCVADENVLLAAMGTEDSAALVGDIFTYKELNVCLAWSSLGRCQVRPWRACGVARLPSSTLYGMRLS